MILFVCSQGRSRSRTAEVLALLGGVNARCCGTDSDAMVPVNNQLLRAAETIICMERHHAKEIKTYMGSEGKVIVSLGIEDVWNPFDPMLIDQLILLIRHRLGEDALADAMMRGEDRLNQFGIDFFGGKHQKSDT